MSQKFPIRPLRIPETIDVGLAALREQFPKLLALLLLLLIPWGAAANLFVLIQTESNPEIDFEQLMGILSLTIVIQLVVMTTFVPWATGAMTRVVYSALFGTKPPTVSEAIWRTLPRLPALFVASLVVWIGATIGKLLLVGPGLLVEALFLPLVPVMILERIGPIKGLTRAADLAMKDYWKAIVLVAVTWAIGFMLNLCKALIPELHAQSILVSVIQGCEFMIGTSLSVAFYLSTRARFESIDLDLMVDQLRREAAANANSADATSRWSPQYEERQQ